MPCVSIPCCAAPCSGGGSVAGALLKKKSWSTGDLQGLAAAKKGGAGGTGAGTRGAAAAGGGSGALGMAGSQAPPPAAEVAAAMRKSQSHGTLLAAAVEAELDRSSSGSGLARRRSLSVGQMLLFSGRGATAAAAGSSRVGGSSSIVSATAAGAHRRRPSLGPPLGPVAEEAGPAAVAAPAGPGSFWEQETAADRAARGMRSKSLSVEDAVESVTRQRQYQQQCPEHQVQQALANHLEQAGLQPGPVAAAAAMPEDAAPVPASAAASGSLAPRQEACKRQAGCSLLAAGRRLEARPART
jgi:hypothetical protein